MDYDSWTVVQLRGELKQRSLSSTGRKADLVRRLQESEPYTTTTSAVLLSISAPAQSPTRRRSQTKKQEAKSSPKKPTAKSPRKQRSSPSHNVGSTVSGTSQEALDADSVTIFNHPIVITKYFCLAMADNAHLLYSYILQHRFLFLALVSALLAAYAAAVTEHPFQTVWHSIMQA